jgi:hypothetical protein
VNKRITKLTKFIYIYNNEIIINDCNVFNDLQSVFTITIAQELGVCNIANYQCVTQQNYCPCDGCDGGFFTCPASTLCDFEGGAYQFNTPCKPF